MRSYLSRLFSSAFPTGPEANADGHEPSDGSAPIEGSPPAVDQLVASRTHDRHARPVLVMRDGVGRLDRASLRARREAQEHEQQRSGQLAVPFELHDASLRQAVSAWCGG